eukprot:TRINITY_DN2908_c0_g1_i1.p1 TRINITY_DN2908_c0_g1~~TRINITY_DN2908_c0_g1_i1.p1  ORF type:complete len:230 (+),score=83.69 TRINITY_DN2908_c0_g1_i1:70-690(+)
MSFKFLTLLFAIATIACAQQQPIPKTYDGQVVGKAAAPFLLEMFGDFACPDTRDGWFQNIVPLLSSSLSSEIRFVFHSLPLPWHMTSFDAHQSALIVEREKPGSYFEYVSVLFANQDAWSNSILDKGNRNTLWQTLYTYAQPFGVNQTVFMASMADPKLNWAVRVSYKYSTSRSVVGTPTYFLNGVRVANGDELTSQGWQDLMKSL